MAAELVAAWTMGPERICPNEHEELGPQEVPEGAPDPPGDWSSEDPEEEEEEGGDGYVYQPLTQDPEPGLWDQGSLAAEEPPGPAETTSGIGACVPQPLTQDPEPGLWDQGSLAAEEPPGPAETTSGIQERLQMLRLHLPDPPVDSEEEEEGAAAQSSQSSIPMDPEHVELVKRTMAGVKLPTLGIPAWASEISEDQWTAMVQRTLQARQNLSASRPELK
nr:LOW QUALITY PROTEIN: male-enhanced antigen 1 [Pelodiscus sinensis]|eukprot:XP_025033695.1 LOW QUALITY PROTEIN: male-enhanced antigen 1 [Pelodiscus sinensis]